jgi:hypothetical protein
MVYNSGKNTRLLGFPSSPNDGGTSRECNGKPLYVSLASGYCRYTWKQQTIQFLLL